MIARRLKVIAGHLKVIARRLKVIAGHFYPIRAHMTVVVRRVGAATARGPRAEDKVLGRRGACPRDRDDY